MADDEVEFDTAMLEHGVPIELIGRSGMMIMAAMTPLDLGDAIEITGDKNDGYTVWFVPVAGERRQVAYNSGEDQRELRDFVWVIESAAAFHRLPFSTVVYPT